MHTKGVFITGTGTGVGKTVAAACLLHALRARGINAAPMKPVQTGTADGDDDLRDMLAAAGMEADAEARAHMGPLRFAKPASPHLAARLENRGIGIADILPHRDWLAARYDFVLAEGAGGLLVPLNQRETMLDLIKALGYPAVLVVDNVLGAINHALLSIEVLRAADIAIAGVIFTQSRAATDAVILADNVETILQFGRIPKIGELPYQQDLNSRDKGAIQRMAAKLDASKLIH